MTRSYFNSKADIWDEKIAEKDQLKLEKIAGRLDFKPGSTILDVGTGTGILVPFLLRKIGDGGKLVCLDFAEEMLQKARAKNFNGNIDYVCADIADCRLESGLFDAVVCYSSFPHFRDKSQALKEIYRVLKNGGHLFICHTSSRDKINEVHHRIPGLSDDLIPENNDMQELLSSVGFREVSISDSDHSYIARATKPQ